MERWGKVQQRRGNENPSTFSSTLLDAIYRSIDESNGSGGASDIFVSVNASKRSSTAAIHESTAASAAVNDSAVTRPRRPQPISTSSSSDNSSYGGFSSSEPESAPHNPLRLRPIRTSAGDSIRASAVHRPPRPQPPLSRPPLLRMNASPPPMTHHQHYEEKKSNSIRRNRDVGKSKAPASPGARLASFINSLLTTAAGTPRKSKTSASNNAAASGGGESACSTVSSHSRSCLDSKPPTSRGRQASVEGVKRSVRFYPVSVIVDEDLRPCGQKNIYCKEQTAAQARRPQLATTVRKKRVEELRRDRGFQEEDDDEESSESSESSSDLFELEIGRGYSGGYRDELPVYETTHLASPRALSHGHVFML